MNTKLYDCVKHKCQINERNEILEISEEKGSILVFFFLFFYYYSLPFFQKSTVTKNKT